MENATKFRKRAQHWEERAATAIDPETREQWRRVADAWHSAAEAAARTPPLILGVGAGAVEGRLAASAAILAPIFLGLHVSPRGATGFFIFNQSGDRPDR